MTDIVERLRQGAGHIPDDIMEAERVMAEAADEIERLRAQVKALSDDLRLAWRREGAEFAHRALEPRPCHAK